MIATIEAHELSGSLVAPASKSYTHRGVITAALAEGTSRISNPLTSDDTEATMRVLKELGVEIQSEGNIWTVEGGRLRAPKKDLFCNESGTTLRFITAICTAVDGRCKITGAPGLLKKPVGELVNALTQLGAKCTSNGDLPPVITDNSLIGGTTSIRGDISSQFISALLLVAPLAKKPVTVKLTTKLESLPYVEMTVSSQKFFGIEVETSEDMRTINIKPQKYKPADYNVEGDWSSAAFLLAAGALSGKVKVSNLNLKSLQADRVIVDALGLMDAKMTTSTDSVTVSRSSLKGIDFDVSNCPDLFPILCGLCAAASGKSRITGIERLKIKESDRITEMETGLLAMGISFRRIGNAVEITGSPAKGAVINSKDHRIAMSFGVLGSVAKGKTVIMNAECVDKSFPSFWEFMDKINADVKVSG